MGLTLSTEDLQLRLAMQKACSLIKRAIDRSNVRKEVLLVQGNTKALETVMCYVAYDSLRPLI